MCEWYLLKLVPSLGGSSSKVYTWLTTVFGFVNDLPKTVTGCTINLYADDTAIYNADNNPVKVQNAINSDLDCIVEWTESNKLQINVMKTQAMTLCKRAAKKQTDEITIRLEGSIIPKLHSVKYLGVTIDEDLS